MKKKHSLQPLKDKSQDTDVCPEILTKTLGPAT